MVIVRGEVWWADLGEPVGSGPGFGRPVVVVSADAFNLSRIATVVCCVITSNLRWADAPGNVLLSSGAGGLDRPSVVNVSQVVTIDKSALRERLGALEVDDLELLDGGMRKSLAL